MTEQAVRELLRETDTSVAPRPGFQEELWGVLSEEIRKSGNEHVAPVAPIAPLGLPRRVVKKLRSGWWLQSAAAVIVLSLVASGTAWTSCLQSIGPRQAAAPAPEVGAVAPGTGAGPADPATIGSGPSEGGPGTLESPDPGSQGGVSAKGTGGEPGSISPPGAGTKPSPPGKPPKKPDPPGVAPPQPSAENLRTLAVASKTNGSWHIFTMKEDGSDRRQLTDGPSHDRAPEWSPDGQQIAFMRLENDEQHDGKIFIMNPDGSGLRFLVAGGEPSWSPDGTQLVYYTGPPSTLHIINADGSGAHPISTGTGFALADPHWSPRGDRIAFAGAGIVLPPEDLVRHPNKVTQVYTVRPDGSEVRRLTDYTWACNMAFSPDGRQIAYTASSDLLSTTVWKMNTDGTGKTQLATGTGVRAYPHWSPDGKRIAFAWDPDGDAHWSFVKSSVGPAPSAIWIMRSDGSDLHRVSPSGVDDADPAFRP